MFLAVTVYGPQILYKYLTRTRLRVFPIDYYLGFFEVDHNLFFILN
jgi:hypothetical protein